MKGFFSFLGALLMLAIWIAASTAIYLGCSELNEVSCDPQTAYDRCEPELGTYTR